MPMPNVATEIRQLRSALMLTVTVLIITMLGATAFAGMLVDGLSDRVEEDRRELVKLQLAVDEGCSR